jgi:hypothetical protein
MRKTQSGLLWAGSAGFWWFSEFAACEIISVSGIFPRVCFFVIYFLAEAAMLEVVAAEEALAQVKQGASEYI